MQSAAGAGGAYCDRCANCDYIAFFYQQLSCFVTDLADLGLWYGTACSQLRDGSSDPVSAQCTKEQGGARCCFGRDALTCRGRSSSHEAAAADAQPEEKGLGMCLIDSATSL